MVAMARDFAQAKGFIEPPGYRRHRPESTLLYRLVAEHYPGFRDRRSAEERPLPGYVEAAFEAYRSAADSNQVSFGSNAGPVRP